MRLETRTVRVGEWLDTPTSEWAQLQAAIDAPEVRERVWKDALQVAQDPKPGAWAIEDCYGYAYRVKHVGVYDGWPSWRPRVVVARQGVLTPQENTDLYQVREFFRVVDCPTCGGSGRGCHRFLCKGWVRG